MSRLATSIGAIEWVDLSTPDIEESVSFYAQLFDWDIESATGETGTYYLGKVGGGGAAGMMQRTGDVGKPLPAAWSIYVRVESVEDAAARATLLGGTAVPERFDMPGNGRIAGIVDPTGAAFVVVAGSEDLGMVRNAPGALVGCELLTWDVDRALHFYIEMFGWEPTVDLEAAYVTLHHAGEEVAGLMAMPAEVPPEAPSHWLPYFAVADCEEACARVQRTGGTLAMPLRALQVEDASIKMAVAEDSLGAMVGLIEHVV